MTFQLADLGFHVELFSKPHSSCWKWGCWIWGFFPPHLPSPGAGLLISSGRTGRHTIPTMALSLWKKTPVAFVKVLGGVRVLTTSQPFFFFFLKKEKKKKIAHSTQFPARQFQIGTPVSQRPGHTAPSDKPRCLRNRSVGIALPAAAPLAPLSTNFLRLQEWREWDSGDSLPLL